MQYCFLGFLTKFLRSHNEKKIPLFVYQINRKTLPEILHKFPGRVEKDITETDILGTKFNKPSASE